MQMRFYDLEEFNELQAESKNKEAPRKKKEEKQKENWKKATKKRMKDSNKYR